MKQLEDSKQDDIFKNQPVEIGSFVFDEKVAEVFADMIERSVPGYKEIIEMISTLTSKFAKQNSNLYDLGCSLGASTKAMAEGLACVGCKIYAIDSSKAMINRCRNSQLTQNTKVETIFIEENILDTKINNASVVVLNFTLQFIEPCLREELLKKIFEGMNSGGILILSEKVRFDNLELNELLIDIHHKFKKNMGYTELEISRKRTAIENVLLPETIFKHQERLLGAGFKTAEVWFQCFNFMSMLAIK